MDPEWDPHDPSFSAQEDVLFTTGGLLRERLEEFRVQFVAGIHMNPCKSLQECGDRSLENFLTTHIIVSGIGGEASTRMQPIEPTGIASKWGFGLESERLSLECTTQRGMEHCLKAPLSFSLQCETCLFQSNPPLSCNISGVCGLHPG